MLKILKNWLFLRVWETGSDIDMGWNMGMWPARVMCLAV
ncbi:Mitochondrial ribonuclease P 1 [Gossypium arboreum]|uniref:Mitochondrial ribonuclease P 1 n=1 Tax=Gossypium arboreum TaxID=29729 RepID=A0A0B0MCE0_GOSAR|nr:Mitochondrial ribonuclease P 1 [Gossypium arboreum]